MASLTIALAYLLGDEGGYADNPADTGGETYAGISRRYWPKWPGWPLIDHEKRGPNFPASLTEVTGLQTLVESFYCGKAGDDSRPWWSYDGVLSQAIANKVFDEAVNMENGNAGPAIGVVQLAVTKLGHPVKDDGIWGDATRAAVNACSETALLHELRARYSNRYHQLLRQNPANEVFAMTWFRRAAR